MKQDESNVKRTGLLNTWKEISNYTQQSMRTCQRWAKENDFPVYRYDNTPKSRVFAYMDEIDKWLSDKKNTIGKHPEIPFKKNVLSGTKIFLIIALVSIIIIGIILVAFVFRNSTDSLNTSNKVKSNNAHVLPEWKVIKVDSIMPPPRGYPQMIYDPIREKIVLFGGASANDIGLNDLWEFDGTQWAPGINPDPLPPPRYAFQMVYDSHRNVIIVFGGEEWPTFYNDTWEYDLNNFSWKKINTAHSPIGRAWFGMCYDSQRKIVVVFGGLNWYTRISDTWEYDGVDWVQRFPLDSPEPRERPAVAFDDSRGVTVLFGGLNHSLKYSDTWEWDGINWTKINTKSIPYYWGHMIYDNVRKKITVLDCCTDHDLWEYDGKDWTPIVTGVFPIIHDHTIIYNPNNQSIILLAGYIRGVGEKWLANDIYEFELNRSPIAVCKDIKINIRDKQEVNITPEMLDSGSFDPDADPITFSVDNAGPFLPGEHYVRFTVIDQYGKSDTCQVKITVVDDPTKIK